MDKKSRIEKLFCDIFDVIFEGSGENWRDDQHLVETPSRLSKMFLDEIFMRVSGTVNETRNSKTLFDNRSKNTVVEVKNLVVKAFCAHHLAPFVGHARVRYLPKNWILGLSKFQRLLSDQCGRPSVQEELTYNFARSLIELLDPIFLNVKMACVHTCMVSRGVKLDQAVTVTEFDYNESRGLRFLLNEADITEVYPRLGETMEKEIYEIMENLKTDSSRRTS